MTLLRTSPTHEGLEITPHRIYPQRSGRAIFLGPLELAMMEVLWKTNLPTPNSDVRRALARNGIRRSASTIETTMHRLEQKGFVQQTRMKHDGMMKPGFQPVLTADAFDAWMQTQLERLLDRIFLPAE